MNIVTLPKLRIVSMKHPLVCALAILLVLNGLFAGSSRQTAEGSASLTSSQGPLGPADNVQLISWEPGPPMTTPRIDFGVLVADGYLFAMGGSTPDGLSAGIERSQIQPDGSLGQWNTYYDGRIPLPMSRFSLASSDGFVYIVGGDAGTEPLPLVAYAPVTNAEIQRRDWKFANSIPEVFLRLPTALATKGRLFVFYAGRLRPGNDVEARGQRGIINPDGSVGPWVGLGDLGIVAPAAAVSYGDWIYLLGGSGAYHGSSGVYRATLGTDGSLSPVEKMATMNASIDQAYATILDGAIYVAGSSYFQPFDLQFERATILSDGTLSPWERLPSFSGQRRGAGLASTGASLQVLGGFSSTGQTLASTERLWLAPHSLALPLLLKGNLTPP